MTVREKSDVWLTSSVLPAGWEPGRQGRVPCAGVSGPPGAPRAALRTLRALPAVGRRGSAGCDVEGPARP